MAKVSFATEYRGSQKKGIVARERIKSIIQVRTEDT